MLVDGNDQLAGDILEGLADESDLSLVEFDNYLTGVDSIPNAASSSSTTHWVDAKANRYTVDQVQLEST